MEQGNHVTILRHDKPVAELRPITPIMPKARVAGSAKGQISYTNDAFHPMAERELDEIDQRSLEIARRRFRADLARQRLIVAPPVHENHFHSARKLLIQYGVAEGLRTLDALQLAIALDLLELGQIGVIVAADQRLCRVASLAGCSTVNPEQPGPVLI